MQKIHFLFLGHFQDPFGDRRGQFEYGSILQRLKKLKTRFESLQNTNHSNNASSSRSSTSSTSKHQQIDARTREIMNDAAAIDPNPTANDAANLDDIFDNEDDDPDSSMDDDDDDDVILDDEQEVNVSGVVTTIQNTEQSKEKTST